ncbi:MAG: type I glyceraldehyde-3-phosphate dehydrogenase [bacterium]|nr:type I glyceraldehyde-3-phosphate dehydrogenase [bacterium]
MALKVAINGFGRIGRLIFRAGLDEEDLEFVAVNDLTDAETLAYLLQFDSVHGGFMGEVEAKDGSIMVDGKELEVLSEKDPGKLPWNEMGVDLVIESTGFFESREKSLPHIEGGGAKKVIITAPAKGADLTCVIGVNEDLYDPEKHLVVSTASCTTNALAVPLKVLNDRLGVVKGFINTAHSYTNSQALLDSPKGKLRRSRAAAINLVPTSTGAARAIGLVIPELEGKMDGLAVRTPTPAGSIIDITCQVRRETSVDEVNDILMEVSTQERMEDVLFVTDQELVSSDIVGSYYSSIIDSSSTMVLGDMVKIMAWYDNEWGYSCRVVDMALLMGEKGI